MRSRVARRTMVLSFASACLIALATAPPAIAVAGTLDPAFSGDGKAFTNFTTGDDYIWDIALQLDGKVVGAGGSDGGRFVALARYNADGTPDGTFGVAGKVTTDMTTGADQAQAVAVQADQKIVVAGRAGGRGGRFGLARYDTFGVLDPGFSGDGMVFTNLAIGYDHAWALAIQPDGKIVAAGAAQVGGGAFALARYNTDGSRDGTFSGDGKVTMNPTTGWEDAAGVGIQPDGKIVIAGAGGGNGGRLLVMRFNADGGSDNTFSGDGMARTNFTSRDDFAWDVSLQTDGKIVAAGTAGLGSGTADFAVVRYGTTGTLDSSFGAGGKVVTSLTAGTDVATAVTIQLDGNIVVGGGVSGAGGRFGVARYLAA